MKIWRQNRIKKVKIPDGRRSEQLVSRLEQQWRTGTAPPELQAKLDALAEQWHALPIGSSPTLERPIVER